LKTDLPYQIALTKIEGVGDVIAKNLISYCGSVEGVFKEKKAFLEKIPNIGIKTAASISKFSDFDSINKEIEDLVKHKIETLFYLDAEYPKRLKNYDDSPIVLYYKGTANLNHSSVISVVGTRKSSTYGKLFTDQLAEALSPFNPLIVSGLADGSDTNAHKAALKNNMETVGVLGHGLHTIFPSSNRNLAAEMLSKGGLLTEYAYKAPGMKENFPKRNRIVAGMCDALIIIESGEKGGSMITVEIANSYNKDVYALPGRMNDTFSKGCNKLISQNKAAIIYSTEQLLFELGFDKKSSAKKTQQISMYVELNETENMIINMLRKEAMAIDDLFLETKISMSKLALLLLDLEFKNLVISLPGKKYALN